MPTDTHITSTSTINAPRTLAQLHRRTTAYEVVAVLPTGAIRLGFTTRPSKHTLLALAQRADNLSQILPHVSDDVRPKYNAERGWTFGSTVAIKLSGRTERECACEELAA